MFWKGPSKLDLAIDKAFRELDRQKIGTEDFTQTLEALDRLHKMKSEERSSFVSKDTLALAGTNLMGIFMIISHERVNVITSRAMSLLLRPR